MTRRKIESRSRNATGPGNPPVEYRFRKGQSGNPAGRPRQSGAPGNRLRGADEPTQRMILDEAYGVVTVCEGDSEIEMPMNQAVFRAIGLAALKGSLSAQRRWAEMVQAAEAAQKRAQVAIYNVAERQDKELAARLHQWKMENEDDVAPHDHYAEDIIVDGRSGTIVIREGGAEESAGQNGDGMPVGPAPR